MNKQRGAGIEGIVHSGIVPIPWGITNMTWGEW